MEPETYPGAGMGAIHPKSLFLCRVLPAAPVGLIFPATS